MTPTRLAPLKVALRKNWSCSMGLLPRSSTTMKSVSVTAATTKHDVMRAEAQP